MYTDTASKTRWYLIDTDVVTNVYYCLCYEDNSLVERVKFDKRFSALDFGENWRYQEHE